MKFNALENIQRKPDGVEPNSLPKQELEKSPREILNIEIEGKNYEVIKTHFTYPENIQKENGGVEGYDRFQLSWDKFDQEKKNNELNEISKKLGIGTEMKEETISHYVNGAQYKDSKLEWNNNRFFLNKPYDISNLIDSTKTKNEQVMSGGGNTIYCLINKEKLEDFEKEQIGEKIDIVKNAEGAQIIQVDDITEYILDNNIDSIINIKSFLTKKDIVILPGMSFAQGSNLETKGAVGLSLNSYETTFFNFNDRNNAYKKYKENTKIYLEKNKEQLGPWKERINSSFCSSFSDAGNSHPMGLLVFTKDFPAFNWAMADTAYVPMKDGPNFFRFYSNDKDSDNNKE